MQSRVPIIFVPPLPVPAASAANLLALQRYIEAFASHDGCFCFSFPMQSPNAEFSVSWTSVVCRSLLFDFVGIIQASGHNFPMVLGEKNLILQNTVGIHWYLDFCMRESYNHDQQARVAKILLFPASTFVPKVQMPFRSINEFPGYRPWVLNLGLFASPVPPVPPGGAHGIPFQVDANGNNFVFEHQH